jgi:biotin carboxylase
VTARPWLIVGFVPVLPAIAGDFEPGSVILLDEPDVIRKRGIAEKMAGSPMLRELIEWPYQEPGSAEEFFAQLADLNPSVVAPLVEYATPFAARLAELYGVPGAGHEAAKTMRDKALLRQATRAAGIRNPESEAVDSPEDVRRFMATHPGPVILKPANRQASVGTMVLQDADEVDAAWRECVEQDEGIQVPDREIPLRMLVERHIRGAEYSVEMLVREGVPLFTNITEKLLYPGPRPIELGHLVPADLPEDTARALRTGTADVLRAVAFGSGMVHCEWIVSDNVPYLVECAGRFAGDGIPALIMRAYDIDLAADFYTVMQGSEPLPLPEQATRGAAVRFLQVPPGTVTAVEGIDAAEAVPGVMHASVTVAPGDTVHELRSSWDRVGSVMACAATAAEAMKIAEQAAELIRVTVE